MHRIWIASLLALLVVQVTAADQAQKAETATIKAEGLEYKASAAGGKVSPAQSEKLTKPEAQAVDPDGKKPLDDAISCLARTIYWEAKGEGIAGMEAIANVVMNRLGHEGFPNTVCEVVKQGQERKACQFSWWCDGRADDAQEEKAYTLAKEVARKALNRQLKDRTGGALYFHHRKVSPKWSAEYMKTTELGDHIFYKPSGRAAK